MTARRDARSEIEDRPAGIPDARILSQLVASIPAAGASPACDCAYPSDCSCGCKRVTPPSDVRDVDLGNRAGEFGDFAEIVRSLA